MVHREEHIILVTIFNSVSAASREEIFVTVTGAAQSL